MRSDILQSRVFRRCLLVIFTSHDSGRYHAYLEIADCLLGFAKLLPVLKGQSLFWPAQSIGQELQYRVWGEECSSCHINVQGQPILTGPQALLVAQPDLHSMPILTLSVKSLADKFAYPSGPRTDCDCSLHCLSLAYGHLM